MKPEEMATIADMAKLAGFLPYLQREVERAEKALENRVFDMLRKGTLTPELSQVAWIEKAAYQSILRRFNQQIRIGTALGERNRVELEQTTPIYTDEPPLP